MRDGSVAYQICLRHFQVTWTTIWIPITTTSMVSYWRFRTGAFVLALNSETDYVDQYKVPAVLNGDIDGNGVHDFDDIDDFIALLNAPAVGRGAIPEPCGLELAATGMIAMLLVLLLRWARPMRLARRSWLADPRAMSTAMM